MGVGDSDAPGQGGPLLERDAERTAVGDALDDARLGRGSVLLVEGPAGIGKTAILRLAHALAPAAGAGTLEASAGELERDFPFGVVRQLFEPVLTGPGVGSAQREELLTGAAGRARAVLGDERSKTDREATPAQESAESVLHGLYWLTANLAERSPLLITVDDIHWADRYSLRFLAYLAHRIAALPVALLLGLRSGESHAEAELRAMVAHARILELPPLSTGAVARLASERLGGAVSDEFAAACEHVTTGNPYLVRELLTSLSQTGVRPTADVADHVRGFAPRTVARAVLARLAGLSPEAERLARAVALLGRDAELRHAAQIAGLDQETAAAAADTLVAATVLAPGRPLEFAHPLVRSAVYAELPAATRGLDHKRAAKLLAAEEGDPERVATHLLAVEPAGDGWVVARLREAAAKVLAAGAPHAAVTYLERASAEPPAGPDRSDVLLALGVAQASLGEAEAPATLRSALAGMGSDAGRARTARVLSRALHMRGDSLAAARVLEASIAELPETRADLRQRLEADLLLMTQSTMAARHHLAAPLARARAGADELSGPTAPVVRAVVAVDLAHTDGAASAAARYAQRALDAGEVMLEEGDVSVSFYLATVALALCDRLTAAQAGLDTSVASAQQRGSLTDLQSALCVRSWILHRRGRLRDAESDARLALDQPHEHGGDILRAWKLAALAAPLMERGELDEAAALLSPAELGPYEQDSMLYQPFRDACGRLALLRGDPRAALDHLEAEGDWERRWGVRNPGWTSWRSHAVGAHRALGNPDRAAELARADLDAATAFGADRALGIALRTLGLVEGAAGLERLGRAAEVLAGSEARLEHARALHELGAALRRAGRRADARERLHEALDLADRCGATALAANARAELVVAGARPRRKRLSGVEALTPQERRVVQMAARGQTNREIAEALFLTKRTIEMHLANAYRKLGIQTRKELPRTLDPSVDER